MEVVMYCKWFLVYPVLSCFFDYVDGENEITLCFDRKIRNGQRFTQRKGQTLSSSWILPNGKCFLVKFSGHVNISSSSCLSLPCDLATTSLCNCPTMYRVPSCGNYKIILKSCYNVSLECEKDQPKVTISLETLQTCSIPSKCNCNLFLSLSSNDDDDDDDGNEDDDDGATLSVQEQPSNSSTTTDLIIGLAVGVGGGSIFIIVLIVVVIIILRRRKTKHSRPINLATKTMILPNNSTLSRNPYSDPPLAVTPYESLKATSTQPPPPTYATLMTDGVRGETEPSAPSYDYDNAAGRSDEEIRHMNEVRAEGSSSNYNYDNIQTGLQQPTTGSDETILIENNLYRH